MHLGLEPALIRDAGVTGSRLTPCATMQVPSDTFLKRASPLRKYLGRAGQPDWQICQPRISTMIWKLRDISGGREAERNEQPHSVSWKESNLGCLISRAQERALQRTVFSATALIYV